MDARWQVADNSAKSIITLGRYHEEDRFQTEYLGLSCAVPASGERLRSPESARLKAGATIARKLSPYKIELGKVHPEL
jgi:hypothetical protein